MQTAFSGSERRSARVLANISIRLLLNGQDHPPGRSAHTVDLSDLGLRVRTSSTLRAGETIRIDSWGGDGQHMPSRVVWVQQSTTGECVAGLEFLGVGQA